MRGGYEIRHAPSGRSKCKICRRTIPHGAKRLQKLIADYGWGSVKRDYWCKNCAPVILGPILDKLKQEKVLAVNKLERDWDKKILNAQTSLDSLSPSWESRIEREVDAT